MIKVFLILPYTEIYTHVRYTSKKSPVNFTLGNTKKKGP